MKTLEQIGEAIGFKTKSKNYRKAFYDKYIHGEKYENNYNLFVEHYDLIDIFNLEDKLNWNVLSHSINLPEEFIKKYFYKLDIFNISVYQKLSEEFILDNCDILYMGQVSTYQKLSEDFIRQNYNILRWDSILINQKLSEDFLREFKYIMLYDIIIKHQTLSKEFIEEFKHKFDICNINDYQYFDKEFEHDLNDLSKYEIVGDYVYGYKSVRRDRYSLYNFQYQYLDGTTHESHSDQTSYENSFGLSVGTKEFAINHGKEISKNNFVLLYVRTKISDITRIVHCGHKLRSRRIEILHEVKY